MIGKRLDGWLVVAVAAALVVTAACSSGGGAGSTKTATMTGQAAAVSTSGVTSPTITPPATTIAPTRSPAPATPTQAAATVTPPALAMTLASPTSTASTGPQQVAEIAMDNHFSQPEVSAKANQTVELTLTNQGQAMHNWHVVGVKDKDGNDVMTKLLNAGESDTIQFVATEPGTYAFLCDVHPVDMRGSLTIVP